MIDAQQIIKQLDVSLLDMKLASGEGSYLDESPKNVFSLEDAPSELIPNYIETVKEVMNELGIKDYNVTIIKRYRVKPDRKSPPVHVCLHGNSIDSKEIWRSSVSLSDENTIYFASNIFPDFVETVKKYRGFVE